MDSFLNETEYVKEYTFFNESGDASVKLYQIYPGVEVAYISVHMDVFDFKISEENIEKNYIRIRWCKEGRIEQEGNNEFFYLMPGDCSIEVENRHVMRYSFPTNHYHGITIRIDTDASKEYFSSLAKSLNIGANVLMDLCNGEGIRILRSMDEVESILLDFYSIHDDQRIDYLKIKLHELFYKMKYIKTQPNNKDISVPKARVEFVKDVAKYLIDNINNKITLKDISTKFAVSDTYLQKSFREVYGIPVISFIRVQKMHAASLALIHTDKSISDIALEFGYENESKFSAAFKKIIGDSPSVYRKEHSKIKIL